MVSKTINEKRICIFIGSMGLGGAEKQSLLLNQELLKEYEVYFVQYRSNISQKYFDQGFKIKNHLILKGNTFIKIFIFYNFLKKNKINIIFCFLTINNLIGSIVGKLAKVKYIIGGVRSCKLPPIKLIVNKFLHNYVLDYTIVNNYAGKEYLVKNRFDASRIIVIQNGIKIHKEVTNRKETNEILILSVGRFDLTKDYQTALVAIKKLICELDAGYSIKYCIVGYGKFYENIKKTINELDLNDYVEIISDNYLLENILLSASIYLSTSVQEGLSNSVMEAMVFSLPIVATDVGDNSKLVDHTRNGYLTKTKDTSSIAKYLKILVQNDELRMRLGNYSYQKISKEFNLDIFYRKYKTMIDEKLSDII